ncbi:hypothetical protein BH24ACT20_BH24ACT20_07320 [soil metagenome]
MRTLIVSRTIGGSGEKRCIGGITRLGDAVGNYHYTSIRLMKPGSHKGFWPKSAPCQIGDVWDLELEDLTDLEPPHVEDKFVRGGQRVTRLSNRELEHRLLEIAPSMIPTFYWEGGPHELFSGKLERSWTEKGFVTRTNTTDTSTGFWIPDSDLTLGCDPSGKFGYYHYGKWSDRSTVRYLKYVGEPKPIELIPRETLVRVSLARWWIAGNHPEACWLMMSGWY